MGGIAAIVTPGSYFDAQCVKGSVRPLIDGSPLVEDRISISCYLPEHLLKIRAERHFDEIVRGEKRALIICKEFYLGLINILPRGHQRKNKN